jgi:hypothetical protein
MCLMNPEFQKVKGYNEYIERTRIVTEATRLRICDCEIQVKSTQATHRKVQRVGKYKCSIQAMKNESV